MSAADAERDQEIIGSPIDEPLAKRAKVCNKVTTCALCINKAALILVDAATMKYHHKYIKDLIIHECPLCEECKAVHMKHVDHVDWLAPVQLRQAKIMAYILKVLMTPALFDIFDYDDWETFASLYDWYALFYKKMTLKSFLGDSFYPNACFPTDIIGKLDKERFGIDLGDLIKLKEKISTNVAYESSFTGELVPSEDMKKAELPKLDKDKKYLLAPCGDFILMKFDAKERLPLAKLMKYHQFYQEDMSPFDFMKRLCIEKTTHDEEGRSIDALWETINDRVKRHNQK